MRAEPFSFPIVAAEIPAAGRRYRLEADAGERSRLAAALQIPAVEEMLAELYVRPLPSGAFSVCGDLWATVVQTDVVSLDPVTQYLREAIELTLRRPEDAPHARRAGTGPEQAAQTDEADLFHNGRIDLGVIAAEHLALGLDPYPRAPGVEFPGHIEDDPAADPSPFAALAALKPRGE